MTISEKVAYLKGLADGLDIDAENSKVGKLLTHIIGILEEVGMSIEDLEDSIEAMGEEIDAISDDLSDVEEVIFEEDDEDEDDDDCCCGDEDEDEDFFEVECPNCGADLTIDESVLAAGCITCPACDSKFAIDVNGCEDDDCGCGCGCDHDHDHE